MEILPHFWISEKIKKNYFLKLKKINYVIFLSKSIPFYQHTDIEQIRISLNITDNNKNDNIIIYQHLFDVTNYIFEKIYNNKNILLVGNEDDSSMLYLFILCYYIRYGKLDIENSLLFLETKLKMKYFNYNNALFKFYNEINKNNI
jgi:hypothetical protein